MTQDFCKYQGTGNDFVMVDNRDRRFPKEDAKLISFLCDRKFGIGADGLILLEEDEKADFKMVYFNSDGNEGSMCGNGGRCIVAFAKDLGVIDKSANFTAVDGLHSATIKNGLISLRMGNVAEVRTKPNYIFLNTGSPHHVQLVKGLADFEVVTEGRKLRYGMYGEKGSNINFVEPKNTNAFSIRTYERGVEDETLSCGTGATAVAIAMHASGKATSNQIKVFVLGGELEVKFDKVGDAYQDVYLIGPAEAVFKGTISC